MTDLTQFLEAWSRDRCVAFVQEQNAIAAERIADRNRTKAYNRTITDVQIIEAITLREVGHTWDEIGAMLDVRESSIRYAIKRWERTRRVDDETQLEAEAA